MYYISRKLNVLSTLSLHIYLVKYNMYSEKPNVMNTLYVFSISVENVCR